MKADSGRSLLFELIRRADGLSTLGPKGGATVPPLNLVGDSGGGLLLAYGMVCALLETRTSGVGPAVDGAMIVGSALLADMLFEMSARDRWSVALDTNVLDRGAPCYDTYEISDGKWVAVGVDARTVLADWGLKGTETAGYERVGAFGDGP